MSALPTSTTTTPTAVLRKVPDRTSSNESVVSIVRSFHRDEIESNNNNNNNTNSKDEVTTNRQRPGTNKQQTGSGNAGNCNNDTKNSRNRKRRRKVTSITDTILHSSSSMTVRIVLFGSICGLTLCLLDVFYIWGSINTVEHGNRNNSKNNGSRTSITNNTMILHDLIHGLISKGNEIRQRILLSNVRQHLQDTNSEQQGHISIVFDKNEKNPVQSQRLRGPLSSVSSNINNNITIHTELIGFTQYNPKDDESNQGKGPILELVKEALGLDTIEQLDIETRNRLPTVADVVSLYGPKPIVYGLETCQVFQKLGIDPANHIISTAGTFNTGTNLMAELLLSNCYMPLRYKKYRSAGVRWQVQWGKHTPIFNETFRQTHNAFNDTVSLQSKVDDTFPIVTIRDPFKWMQSMCRHEYAARWHRDITNSSHCPNLVQVKYPIDPVQVLVRYKEFNQQHNSLVHFWNEWYNEYINAKFPRLLVRFEDLIFHPKEVTKLACECAGGAMKYPSSEFKYITDSAKKGKAHGGAEEKTSYIDALIKYGTVQGRYDGYHLRDLQFAQNYLDPKLMELLGYKYPTEIEGSDNFTLRIVDETNVTTIAAMDKDSEQERTSNNIDERTELIGFSKYDPRNDESNQGKGPIFDLVKEALGLDTIEQLDVETKNRLPTVSDVISLYGPKPIVYGLDTCQQFQRSGTDSANHIVSTAGTFNTGTNLMAELLISNCYMPEKYNKDYGSGVRWQVPWGKHTPISNETFRQTHRTNHSSNIQADDTFPIVTIRDPFKWMQSMCRHEYSATWHRDKMNSSHCPNLVQTENLNDPVQVVVRYKEFENHHSSLVHFWNDWYNEYIQAKFPRLLVRFEDVIFHPKEVTKLACECAGGAMKYPSSKFKYITDSAKKGKAHGDADEKTSYIDALIKYGTMKGRYDGYDSHDIQFAQNQLDAQLMGLFGYKYHNTESLEDTNNSTTSIIAESDSNSVEPVATVSIITNNNINDTNNVLLPTSVNNNIGADLQHDEEITER